MSERALPRTGTVPAQGVAISYRDWDGPTAPIESGAASPMPLVLLHGLASSAWIWDLVAPILARDRRVVALDQRGHGRSEKPDTGYDFATIIADDIAAIDQLGLGPRFAVAGHSWGANVALEFGAMQPDRVAALAQVDDDFSMLRQREGATWEQVSQDLAPPDFAGTPRETFLGWMHQGIPNADPTLDEIAFNIVELRPDDTVGPRLSRANHMRILRAMWDEDADALYAAIRAPVLAVLAEPTNPDPTSDQFLAMKRRGAGLAQSRLVNAPKVEIQWLADTVHDIPLQRPEVLAGLIGDFLQGS